MSDNEHRTRLGESLSNDAISVHVQECETCRADPSAVQRVAGLLRTKASVLDAPAMSERIVVRLRPELAQRAAAAFRRRVAVGLLLSLLPLPAVLAYDAYFLRLVYDLASALLPASFAAYVVFSYAAFFLFLCALTYAAIPLLMDRMRDRPALSAMT